MSDQDLHTLLRLLDTMNDHFDRIISDQEFLHLAASARDSLSPSAAHDPALATAVRTLSVLLGTAKDDPLPAEAYGNLRFALADLEKLRKRRHPTKPANELLTQDTSDSSDPDAAPGIVGSGERPGASGSGLRVIDGASTRVCMGQGVTSGTGLTVEPVVT